MKPSSRFSDSCRTPTAAGVVRSAHTCENPLRMIVLYLTPSNGCKIHLMVDGIVDSLVCHLSVDVHRDVYYVP